ncbi:MAG: nucleoside deaminase [Mycoplasmatota bacterium]|nr:nucleoside deaminase [Mycoplasmatota bacterium]
MKRELVVDRLLELSKMAYDNDEIPVGAIVVRNGKIIGEGINNRNKDSSVIGHAEVNAIEMACKFIDDWRLDDCEMYTSLLPCMMCTGTILESRIRKVYYLCDRTNVCFEPEKYINIEIIDDVDSRNKYMRLLQLFFENKRN